MDQVEHERRGEPSAPAASGERPASLDPAAKRVRDICKAGRPGLTHFGGGSVLRVPINAAVRQIRISIPETAFLTVRGAKLHPANGASLPRCSASMSSTQSGDPGEAAALLNDRPIHSNYEPWPWWACEFETP